jgi:predicted nucleotidyltransferase
MITAALLDPHTRLATRLFVEQIVARYDTAGSLLFGSRARQNHRADSDADVAVLLRGAHEAFLKTKLDMADIAFDVLLETGIRVQPLPVWLDEWEHPERHVNPGLLANIARDVVRL